MATPAVVHLRDTRANQPAAAVGNAGVIFGVTDEGDILERSNGTTWESYSPASVDESNVAITGGSITGITDLAIADGGTGASTATAAFDNLAPTTTAGDLIFNNGTDNVRLPIGTAGQVLHVNAGATAPEWSAGGAGVSGPVSSTNNAAAVWDGTGGNTLKDSALVVGASDITIGGNGVYRASGTDVPVADGGTGVSSLTAYAPIFGGTTGTGAVQSGTVGTSGQVLTSNGAGSLPTFQAASSGKVAQIVQTQTGASASGTGTIPIDDTIPQNTEGTEFMTLAITPTSATNKLRIDVCIILSTTAATPWYMAAALFQDSTANALACAVDVAPSSDGNVTINFSYVMTSGTTSSTTFKVRAGANGAGTTRINGRVGARIYGGVLASSITITEYVP